MTIAFVIKGDRLKKVGRWLQEAVDAPAAPSNQNERLINQYLAIRQECETLSDVIDRMGKALENAGLINRRTVACLKGWLRKNNLPMPGEEPD